MHAILRLLYVLTLKGVLGNLCPSTPCVCSFPEGAIRIDVNCNEKNLTEIPKFEGVPPGKSIILSITDNQLTDIPHDSFDIHTPIYQADFSRNSISSIDQKAFSNLTWSLTLDDNMLDGDQVVNINKNNLVFLRHLYINSNKIHTLRSGSFNQMSTLKYLELKNNGLINIEKDAFAGIGYELSELDLSDNSIGSESLQTLVGLHEISHINLRNNSLSIIPAGIFTDKMNIVTLDLSQNEIQSMEDHAFPPFPWHTSMLHLYLQNNLITSDSITALQDTNIHRLHLQNNSLTTIPYETLKDHHMGLLELCGNPMVCDRATCWMKDPFWLDHMDDWTCAAPQKYTDKMFKSISLEDCPSTANTNIRFLFGLVAMVFTVVLENHS